MNRIKWHIGCSGFHYRDWKEIFYPPDIPQKKWFEYYASRFDTLELNVTFYQFPQLKFLQTWFNNSPDGFSFSVKAPRLITHFKKFSECERLLDDFYTTIHQGLKDKLGSVLFQLPGQFYYTDDRLELIINSMRKEFRNSLEFRHESWWTEKVYKRLKMEKLIFCGINHPALPDDAIATNKTAYYRFHGVPELYYSSYKRVVLKKIADSLSGNKTVREAFIYFNNTATIAAIDNAVWLKKYVQKTLDYNKNDRL